jgi:hypothetical protein
MTLEFFIAVRLLLRTGEVAIFDPAAAQHLLPTSQQIGTFPVVFFCCDQTVVLVKFVQIASQTKTRRLAASLKLRDFLNDRFDQAHETIRFRQRRPRRCTIVGNATAASARDLKYDCHVAPFDLAVIRSTRPRPTY